jgi:capsid protein
VGACKQFEIKKKRRPSRHHVKRNQKYTRQVKIPKGIKVQILRKGAEYQNMEKKLVIMIVAITRG